MDRPRQLMSPYNACHVWLQRRAHHRLKHLPTLGLRDAPRFALMALARSQLWHLERCRPEVNHGCSSGVPEGKTVVVE